MRNHSSNLKINDFNDATGGGIRAAEHRSSRSLIMQRCINHRMGCVSLIKAIDTPWGIGPIFRKMTILINVKVELITPFTMVSGQQMNTHKVWKRCYARVIVYDLIIALISYDISMIQTWPWYCQSSCMYHRYLLHLHFSKIDQYVIFWIWINMASQGLRCNQNEAKSSHTLHRVDVLRQVLQLQ